MSETNDNLYQGTAPLWQTRTLAYCFEQPVLANMPDDVRAIIHTQAALDARWYGRVWEFIGAIDTTWQSVQLIDFVPQNGCRPGAIPIHYNQTTTNQGQPNGGYAAGLGQDNTSIEMNADFLGDTFDKMNYIAKSKAPLGIILECLWLGVPYWAIRVIPMATWS